MEIRLDPETNPEKNGSAGRKTERIMLEIPIRVVIPIRVFSFGGSAGSFSEDTHTLMVNRDGALIVSKHRLAPDETIRIINLENLREADFRVVGLAREEGEVSQWGVECLEHDRSLWEIDFPPPLKKTDAKGGALLQCQGCGKQCLIVLSLTEISILEARGAFEKLCEDCGQLTLWEYVDKSHRQAEAPSPKEALPPTAMESEGKTERRPRAMSPLVSQDIAAGDRAEERHELEITITSSGEAYSPSAQINGLPEEAVPRPAKLDAKAEKRIHKRLLMKLPVLVRSRKGEEEIGRTENISKGGFGVSLAMSLTLGERVLVVCPYSGPGHQIEQTAEVRRRLSLYGGKRWLYGFRYVVA